MRFVESGKAIGGGKLTRVFDAAGAVVGTINETLGLFMCYRVSTSLLFVARTMDEARGYHAGEVLS